MDDVTHIPAPTRKTKPKGRHPHKRLSAAFVRCSPPGRHCDGNGLYLYVQPSGARSWVQRLVIRGRRRDFGPRQRRAGLARRGPREGAGQPKARPRRRRSARRAAARAGRPQLRRGDRARPEAEAGRVAQRAAREGLAFEHRALRLPAHRQDRGLGGDDGRRARDPHPDLAREGVHGPVRASADALGAGMGGGDGVPVRQPLRPGPVGPRSAAPRDQAHEGVAASGGGIGDPDGEDDGRNARGQAGLRVPGADGGEGGARCGGPSGRRST